jgi:preprotein translocase subunit SecY
MKNLIDTVKNIWRIEELRNAHPHHAGPAAGVPHRQLHRAARRGQRSQVSGQRHRRRRHRPGGSSSIFTGGAFTRASIFALGIMPYISASIIMQLAGIAVPAVQKMQKEESGRRKMNQWTRYLTIIICVFQAPGYLFYLRGCLRPAPTGQFWLVTSVMILTAGTLFVMWLGERITERGLGNGVSLIIMIGILAHACRRAFLAGIGRPHGPPVAAAWW